MFQRFVLFITLLFTLVFASSCDESINELQETIYSAKDHSVAENEFFATLEILDDVASTDGRLSKTGGTILPASAKIIFIDSLWNDGDGLEFKIDFGTNGNAEPFGTLCQDGRYRSGILHVMLSDRYSKKGSKLSIEITDQDNYFSGDGRNMNQIKGKVVLARISSKTLTIKATKIQVIHEDFSLVWNSETRIRLIHDAGIGIWKDEYEVTGKSFGINREGNNYQVIIDKALVKKVELGCAKSFIKGKVTIFVKESAKTLKVNYDPFEDGACDNVAEVEINGKKTIFKVK